MSCTCGTEMSAIRRRFSTAAPISADPSDGPAGVRRAAVDAASSQLIRAGAWDFVSGDVSREEDSIVPIRSQRTGMRLKFVGQQTGSRCPRFRRFPSG